MWIYTHCILHLYGTSQQTCEESHCCFPFMSRKLRLRGSGLVLTHVQPSMVVILWRKRVISMCGAWTRLQGSSSSLTPLMRSGKDSINWATMSKCGSPSLKNASPPPSGIVQTYLASKCLPEDNIFVAGRLHFSSNFFRAFKELYFVL